MATNYLEVTDDGSIKYIIRIPSRWERFKRTFTKMGLFYAGQPWDKSYNNDSKIILPVDGKRAIISAKEHKEERLREIADVAFEAYKSQGLHGEDLIQEQFGDCINYVTYKEKS
jgi:hypothetical protein